jgi:hypothetical protein
VPGLNETWTKYGCDLCDEYELLVLEVNVNRGPSSKSDLQNYMDKNNVEYPAIWHEEGGTDLATATGNGTSGNPKYVIYPDKTYKKTGTIPSTISEHIHTSSNNDLTKGNLNKAISLYGLHKNGFTINVIKNGIYSISFYAANGRLKEIASEKFLSSGSHKISWKSRELANGIYFVEISNGHNITRQKVILE